MNDNMALLRERWSDPLLTGLTALLVVMLFVMAPLQALGIFVFQAFELVFAIILVAGVFVLSGSRTAFAAMLVSLGMAGCAELSSTHFVRRRLVRRHPALPALSCA